MKSVYLLFVTVLLFSCQQETQYHTIYDIDDYWRSAAPLEFPFEITDTAIAYTINCDLRNSSDYEWSRFFMTYTLRDSAGQLLDSLFLEKNLFDPVTGAPEGKAGIGDLYEHEITVRKGYHFPVRGKYTIRLGQMMRTDSLTGVVSAGIRIEQPK